MKIMKRDSSVRATLRGYQKIEALGPRITFSFGSFLTNDIQIQFCSVQCNDASVTNILTDLIYYSSSSRSWKIILSE